VGPGAWFRGVKSGSCRLGSVGGSGPGASGTVELREKAGSARDRSGARFGRAGVWGGAWFGGLDRGGGTLRQPWVGHPPTIQCHVNHFKSSLGDFTLRAPTKDNCLQLFISRLACFYARDINEFLPL
jgi:hypothetical protein